MAYKWLEMSPAFHKWRERGGSPGGFEQLPEEFGG